MFAGFEDHAAIGKRLRRLSHQIDQDAARLYQANGFQFEQRWFGVLNQLVVKGSMSVKDLSAALGITHASVSETRKSLQAAGYIQSSRDKNDARSRLLSLTNAGLKFIDRIAPIWLALESASIEINKEADNVVLALDRLDEALTKMSLFDRASSKLG